MELFENQPSQSVCWKFNYTIRTLLLSGTVLSGAGFSQAPNRSGRIERYCH
jgi:hypothetical protein